MGVLGVEGLGRDVTGRWSGVVDRASSSSPPRTPWQCAQGARQD